MRTENMTYNWYEKKEKKPIMPKKVEKINESDESFGRRLASLRQAAGYSQRELATEVGISHRMVAYYEKEAGHLPIHLLPVLAKTLGVSADQLLGIEKIPANAKVRDNRLWKRFSQVEKLPPEQRKPIVQILDAFLKKEGAIK